VPELRRACALAGLRTPLGRGLFCPADLDCPAQAGLRLRDALRGVYKPMRSQEDAQLLEAVARKLAVRTVADLARLADRDLHELEPDQRVRVRRDARRRAHRPLRSTCWSG
jgi:hypothetical protein